MNPNPRWLGLVVSAPQIGAAMVIGRPGADDVTLTSAVTDLFLRDDGILVRTEGGSRYFVGIAGNTYRFEYVSDEPQEPEEQTEVDIDPSHPSVHPQGAVPAPLPRSRTPRASSIRPCEPDSEAVRPGTDITVLLKPARKGTLSRGRRRSTKG